MAFFLIIDWENFMKKTLQTLLIAVVFSTSAFAADFSPNAIRLGDAVKKEMTPVTCNESACTRGEFKVNTVIRMRPNGHVSVTLTETTGSEYMNQEILKRVMTGVEKVAGGMIDRANGMELGFSLQVTVIQEAVADLDCTVFNRKDGGIYNACATTQP